MPSKPPLPPTHSVQHAYVFPLCAAAAEEGNDQYDSAQDYDTYGRSLILVGKELDVLGEEALHHRSNHDQTQPAQLERVVRLLLLLKKLITMVVQMKKYSYLLYKLQQGNNSSCGKRWVDNSTCGKKWVDNSTCGKRWVDDYVNKCITYIYYNTVYICNIYGYLILNYIKILLIKYALEIN